tara:strand:+ start:447 stop:656 length:210 start_codon:yes stop_codon:yes gene_type:complete
MYIKISISTAYKISKSNKDFFMYRMSETEDKIVDYILTNDLSRFRPHFNNKFKLVEDMKKNINNLTINL